MVQIPWNPLHQHFHHDSTWPSILIIKNSHHFSSKCYLWMPCQWEPIWAKIKCFPWCDSNSRFSSFLLCKKTVRVGKFMLQHLFWSTTFPLMFATLSCWFSGSFTIGPWVKKHKENQTIKSKIFDIWKVRLEDGQPMFTPSIRASLD